MVNDKTEDLQSKQNYFKLVNKAEDYIEQHLKQSISLSELARNANLSESHFHRAFTKYSSETVNEFITRFKLERVAIYLLVNPRISIIDITLEYGYNDPSSFSRLFKKHFGISPLKYRKTAIIVKNG
ncbi:helix-turn-helix domain-containing protein [Leuconostoc citreum]